MALLKVGLFLYQVASFVIEVISTAVILFLTYTLAKVLAQDETIKVESFVIFTLALALLINTAIWIEELFVKHLKLIRTSIVIDISVVITCLCVVIGCKFSLTQTVMSDLIINQLDNLRLLQNTFGFYKSILSAFEKFFGCCRIPSLVSIYPRLL